MRRRRFLTNMNPPADQNDSLLKEKVAILGMLNGMVASCCRGRPWERWVERLFCDLQRNKVWKPPFFKIFSWYGSLMVRKERMLSEQRVIGITQSKL